MRKLPETKTQYEVLRETRTKTGRRTYKQDFETYNHET